MSQLWLSPAERLCKKDNVNPILQMPDVQELKPPGKQIGSARGPERTSEVKEETDIPPSLQGGLLGPLAIQPEGGPPSDQPMTKQAFGQLEAASAPSTVESTQGAGKQNFGAESAGRDSERAKEGQAVSEADISTLSQLDLPDTKVYTPAHWY